MNTSLKKIDKRETKLQRSIDFGMLSVLVFLSDELHMHAGSKHASVLGHSFHVAIYSVHRKCSPSDPYYFSLIQMYLSLKYV
jgi:hypothetical protein